MKHNVYKYWLFYYIPDGMQTVDPMLYAFTDNKNIAYEFMNIRNMARFYTKKVKLTRFEINRLVELHMKSELTYYDFNEYGKNHKIVKLKIPLTQREMLAYHRNVTKFYDDINKYTINSNIFKNKYFHALKILRFNNFYKSKSIINSSDSYSDISKCPDFSLLNIIFQEFPDIFYKNRRCDNEVI